MLNHSCIIIAITKKTEDFKGVFKQRPYNTYFLFISYYHAKHNMILLLEPTVNYESDLPQTCPPC